MSEEDKTKPVIEVTEEYWEEDTAKADIFELDMPSDPTPVEVDSTERKVAPPQEEHSESHLPQPAAFARVRPSVRPISGRRSVKSRDKMSPSLGVGEQLLRASRIGTGIWYAGVVLWSYLIVGEYVARAGLPEFLGWSLFAGVVVGAFLHGANRIGTQVMGRVSASSAGLVIAGAFLLSTAVGASQPSEYQSISLVLLLTAVALILWGIRFSRGGLPRSHGPPGINWPRLLLWGVFFGNTALALVSFLVQT